MTTRERFNRALHRQNPDRVPNVEFGYWDETIVAWHQQGLPHDVTTNQDVERHLGLEGVEIFPQLPIINGLYPEFERVVLEDRGDREIIRDAEGVVCEVFKGPSSIPRYLKYGIETRQDWETYKRDRLDYTREDRIGDVAGAIEAAHSSGMPIRFEAGSLYGRLRNWMGVENFSIAIKTEPVWVEEMMEHLTEMTLHLIEKALPNTEVDVAWWWEDMCYKGGPLLSPTDFQRMMVPRYSRITQALRKNGIDVNILDCDGRIYKLVQGWLEGGINCMFPIEAAHTDPLVLRETHGDGVLLFGGVNKLSLARGRDSIDRELQRLRPLVEMGGYVPCVDHRVPPDVSYENYLYYLEQKQQFLRV